MFYCWIRLSFLDQKAQHSIGATAHPFKTDKKLDKKK